MSWKTYLVDEDNVPDYVLAEMRIRPEVFQAVDSFEGELSTYQDVVRLEGELKAYKEIVAQLLSKFPEPKKAEKKNG